MKLQEGKVTTILYEKDSGERSSRVILPVHVPTDNIRAIDLSEASDVEREALTTQHEAYREYVKTFMSKMFNFETFVEHSFNTSIAPKWRSFKSSGLK